MKARNEMMRLCRQDGVEAAQAVHALMDEEIQASKNGTVDPDDNLGLDNPEVVLDYAMAALESEAQETTQILWNFLRSQHSQGIFLNQALQSNPVFPRSEWLSYACSNGYLKVIPALIKALCFPVYREDVSSQCAVIKIYLGTVWEYRKHAAYDPEDSGWRAIESLLMTMPDYEAYSVLLELQKQNPQRADFFDGFIEEHIKPYGRFLSACSRGDDPAAFAFLDDPAFEPVQPMQKSFFDDPAHPSLANILDIAIKKGSAALIERLLSYPSVKQNCLNAVDHFGCAPLFSAVVYENAPALRCLLGHPATNKNVIDTYGRNVLHRAAGCETSEIMRICLEDKAINAMVNRADDSGRTPLHRAVLYPHSKEKLDLLVKAGACLNRVDQEGMTALFHATMENATEAVSALLAYSTIQVNRPIESQDGCRMLPLTIAIGKGYLELAEIFLKDGRHDPWVRIIIDVGETRLAGTAYKVHFYLAVMQVATEQVTLTMLDLLLQTYPREISAMLRQGAKEAQESARPAVAFRQSIIEALGLRTGELTDRINHLGLIVFGQLNLSYQRAQQQPQSLQDEWAHELQYHEKGNPASLLCIQGIVTSMKVQQRAQWKAEQVKKQKSEQPNRA